MMKYILILLTFFSLQTYGEPLSIDSSDYYTLANYQWDNYKSRSDFWVLVNVEDTINNQSRTVCVSMKNLRFFVRKQNNLTYDSLSTLIVDSIMMNNTDRKFICSDKKDLNRFFNFDKYSKIELDRLSQVIDLDKLYQKTLNQQFQKYISTEGSEKNTLMIAHLLYEKGIYTSQYSCHGSILYIVNMDELKQQIEKWRLKKISN